MHTVQARGILSAEKCMNVYRGCTHGCIYCDSRSVCYGMDHPFEDVAVKENAPELLDRALRGKKRRCMIHTGAMCDPYLPLEAQCRLTRRCNEIIARRGFGLSIQTKSDGILEDLDLLQRIARQSKCVAQMTLTTCDEKLCKILEPGVCGTRRRARALKQMTQAGIETVAWISPILPFLNDTEENLRGLLELCFDAGVKGILCWNMGVTLREGSREYFYQALDRHFPGLKREYARQYGLAYECVSPAEPAAHGNFPQRMRKAGRDASCGRNLPVSSRIPRRRRTAFLFLNRAGGYPPVNGAAQGHDGFQVRFRGRLGSHIAHIRVADHPRQRQLPGFALGKFVHLLNQQPPQALLIGPMGPEGFLKPGRVGVGKAVRHVVQGLPQKEPVHKPQIAPLFQGAQPPHQPRAPAVVSMPSGAAGAQKAPQIGGVIVIRFHAAPQERGAFSGAGTAPAPQ